MEALAFHWKAWAQSFGSRRLIHRVESSSCGLHQQLIPDTYRLLIVCPTDECSHSLKLRWLYRHSKRRL
jgi:hypothetical protein